MNGRRQKKKWKRTATSSCLKYFSLLDSFIHFRMENSEFDCPVILLYRSESTINTYSCSPCKDILESLVLYNIVVTIVDKALVVF
jgi:hypothetical protein